ncbi:MAG: hypothetical protein WKF92_00100 [Pyrinomonadaceae bacterium]
MKEPEVTESIRTGKLQLDRRAAMSHFGVIGWIVGSMAVAFLMWAIEYFPFTSEEDSVLAIWRFLFFLMVLSSIVVYVFQRSRLRFTKITTPLSREQSVAIIDRLAANHSWKLTVRKKRIRVARTNSVFGSERPGEQITIIWDKENILVNSIRDPKSEWSFRSVGRNKDNVDTIFRAIRNADQNRGIAASR